MKRHARILSISILASAAALFVCAAALARQERPKSDPKSKQAEFVPLKGDATLEETLSWLNDNLKRYGKFTLYQPLYEPGYRDRTRFMGLDGKGCSVRYKVKHTLLTAGGSVTSAAPNPDIRRASNGDFTHSPNIWSPGFSPSSVTEQTLDLTALEPSLVVGKTPEKWDGGSVLFKAAPGKSAVTQKEWNGRVYRYDGGEFFVSEKGHVEEIADALRRAVELCRK